MATTKLMTAEDLAEIKEPGRYDLIRGELICMSPAGAEHGAYAGQLARLIGNHVVEHRLGQYYGAETGFILARDPDVMLAPDVAFVRQDRLPPLDEWRGFHELAPDLVVEIVSPSDRSSEVNAKVLEYLKAGVQLVWLVEPDQRSVTVYHADRSANVLLEDEVLDGNDVLPGFQLLVATIFELPAS